MSALSPTAIDVWTRVLALPLSDRAELLARLADDISCQAINGALGLEFMAVARQREEERRAIGDGTAAPTETPRGRRRTTRMPRPAGHQQFPRPAVDRALGSPQ